MWQKYKIHREHTFFAFFIGKERTSMAAPWGDETQGTKITSFIQIFTELSNEGYRWKQLFAHFLFSGQCASLLSFCLKLISAELFSFDVNKVTEFKSLLLVHYSHGHPFYNKVCINWVCRYVKLCTYSVCQYINVICAFSVSQDQQFCFYIYLWNVMVLFVRCCSSYKSCAVPFSSSECDFSDYYRYC